MGARCNRNGFNNCVIISSQHCVTSEPKLYIPSTLISLINVEPGINVEGEFSFCGGWNFSKLVSVDSTFIREMRVACLTVLNTET